MRKTRFIFVLACMSVVAACTSGEDGTVSNTELNVLVPNNESSPGVPAPIDIGTVEYTINCAGNDDVFLDNDASFDDEVIINGNLEVVDGRTDEQGPIPPEFGTPRPGDGAEVWQAFMDLPPGPCTIQLRARDNDGEVICTATEDFTITADTTAKVNLVLICDVSFQAPVGQLDVDATFSFVVGNFCPDLFQLNCVESNPEVPFPGAPPTTYCEARARDGDSTCGQSCDPQSCVPAADGTGLDCTPGPDNGVSTTITCDQLLDCEGDLAPDAECVFSGDILGETGAGIPVPVLLGGAGPLPGGFFAGCATDPLTGVILFPGSTVTCTAVTTDGDVDCDKTKVVSFTCPGLTPCATFDQANGGSGTQQGADALCDDGNDCTANFCDNAACDGATAGACCDFTNVAAGIACSDPNGFPGTCDGGGTCVSENCNAQADPDGFCDDGNVCTVAGEPGSCLADGSCDTTPTNQGGACSSGVGSDVGLCNNGTCDSQDECQVAGDCPAATPGTCDTEPVCNTATGGAYACTTGNAPDGQVCDLTPGSGNGDGTCSAGVCEPPPTLAPGGGSTSWNAVPRLSEGGTCTYDSVNTVCTGCADTSPVTLQPGGGQCAQFGAQVFGGCEVPGGVLNAQLAIDATVTIAVSSNGTGDVTSDVVIFAENPALGTAAGLVTIDAASVFTSATNANPSALENSLNPVFAGQVLGAFTGGGNVILLDSDPTSVPGIVIGDPQDGIEIPAVTTPVTPISDPVAFDYDNFTLELTITASGTPLIVDDAGCDFNFPGTAVSIPQNP